MAAATKNFLIEQGTTFCPKITFKDDTGTPIDITGWVFAMEIRTDTLDAGGSLILRLDSNTTPATNTILILSAAGGEIQLFIDDSITDGFTEDDFATAVYDLEVDDAGPTKRRRFLQGSVTLSLQVTD